MAERIVFNTEDYPRYISELRNEIVHYTIDDRPASELEVDFPALQNYAATFNEILATLDLFEAFLKEKVEDIEIAVGLIDYADKGMSI